MTTATPATYSTGAGSTAARTLPETRSERLSRALAPYHRQLLAAGALLTVVSAFLPWATYSGFAGKMTLAGYPGGARLYLLFLVGAATVALFDVGGRRGALRAIALGALAIAVVTAGAIADSAAESGWDLGGLGVGAYVGVLGTLLLLLAALGLTTDRQYPVFPTLPSWAELLIVPLLMVLLLAVVVRGLAIEDPSLFFSYLLLLAALAIAAGKLGVSEWMSAITERHRKVLVVAALLAAIAFPFTQDGNAYYIRVFASIGVFAAAAIGLNVVVGLAGLLDLGYIAFFGVGAYVGALFAGAALTTSDIVLPFPLVVLLGAVIAAIFGVLIGAPTLRLRGDYLAIVTLGFGEIFRIAANNLDGQAGPNITRGPNGIAGIPDLKIGSYDFGDKHDVLGITLPGFANYYFLEILLLVFVITAFLRLNTSRVGRAWVAIREDETAATAMGINTIRLKLLAFGIGAFLAGAAGTVNSHVTAQVSPDSYTFLESIFLLAAVVLGGMGTVPGALLGSTLLLLLPEKLRFFSEYRLLIFGLALVLLMRFRPEGLIASRRRKAEFHESDADNDEADALSAPPSMTGGLK